MELVLITVAGKLRLAVDVLIPELIEQVKSKNTLVASYATSALVKLTDNGE
jgi:hypothetical protein